MPGEHTVRKQFYKALGKGTNRLLLSNLMNAVDFDELAAVARKVLETGDYTINEVLVVDPKGEKVTYLRK